MLFVGIDIGKNNHVASMMDESGEVVFKAFSFSNTSDGGNALFSKLTSYSSNPSDFKIGMEATGHYWLSVYSFLFEKGFLPQFSSPIDFEAVSSKTLAKLLAQLSRQKVGTAKAEQLKATASSSFGITFARSSFTFQLKTLIEQISFIEEQVKGTEAEIFGIMGKLAAFAGLDATVTQSGEFEAIHNVMSKRGSPYLRKAIFQAALAASFKAPVLSAYYQNKRAEGKHHLTCVGAVVRKMCNIIYAVLKNNQPYVPKA